MLILNNRQIPELSPEGILGKQAVVVPVRQNLMSASIQHTLKVLHHTGAFDRFCAELIQIDIIH